MQTWQNDFLSAFEKLGEEEVRRRHLQTQYGQPGSERYDFVESWLQSKANLRKEDREEMSLSISRKALSNSRWATIIAIIATIIAASDKVMVCLRWLGVLKP